VLPSKTGHLSSVQSGPPRQKAIWAGNHASIAIARYIREYNHDRPHRGVGNRTPREAFLAFAVLTKNEALTV
jgi:hypothetical protein